jgi:hypothetical protein
MVSTFSVAEGSAGVDDDVVMALALKERRVLLTEDKDFGRLVFAAGARSLGVSTRSFPCEREGNPRRSRARTGAEYADRLAGSFVVLQPKRIRISVLPRDSH